MKTKIKEKVEKVLKKTKSVITFNDAKEIKRKPRKPQCFGEFKTCQNPGCYYKKSCKAILDEDEKQNKKAQKETDDIVAKEKWANRRISIHKYIRRLFSIKYWVDGIQNAEKLAEVLVRDLVVLISLASLVFSIYFLCIRDWAMILCSVAVFLAINLVEIFMKKYENPDQGYKGDQQ